MSKYIRKPIWEVCTIRRWASPRPIDEWMSTSWIPWVKISDATKEDSRFIKETEWYIREEWKNNSVEVFPGDLIISNSATPALPKIMKINACIHDGRLLTRDFNWVTRDYLYYQVKYLQKFLVNQWSWSIFKNLKTDILKEFPIIIPVDDNWKIDISKQEKITKVLEVIEDKMELNNKINLELETMVKELYNYWFVQFDFPNENGRPYKSSGWKMVWNEELKREIPEGWEVKKMLTVLDWVTNSQPPKSKFSYTKKEWYIRFIQNRDYSSDVYITYVPFSKGMSVCSDTDVLIDKYGDAWRLRFGIEWVFNVALAMLKPHNENYLEYIRWYFETDWIYKYLHESCMASTRASLSEENLKHMYIVVPSEDNVKKYNVIASKITRKRLQLNLENKKLSELRDFLLPMLMNGQVTVK